MMERTIRSQVLFRRPFRLGSEETVYASGTYDVETDEVGVEGNDRTVWRRTATLIRFRQGTEMITRTIQPQDLEDALKRDSAT